MKKRILTLLLAVAMLVAMVPMIAVSAEETSTTTTSGTTYDVADITAVNAFIADETKNVAGNTMRLTGDLSYDATAVAAGVWTGLKANVDGNGHKVTVAGATSTTGWILCELVDDVTHTYKNLTVVVAEGGTVECGSMISLFGRNFSGTLNIENCYFDLNLKVTSATSNYGSATLISAQAQTLSATINAKNSVFKFASSGESSNARHGILVGRKFNGASTMTFNLYNCTFDAPNHYIIAQTQDDVTTTVTGSNNLIVAAYGNGVHQGYTETPAGFAKVTEGENAVTTVEGYQTTTVANNKFDLRLVGLVELDTTALTDYTKVGFIVEASYGTVTKRMNAASTKVYEALKGYEGDTGLVEYTAEALGGDYLYALAIKNIPADAGVITFTVTPYYIANDGTALVEATATTFSVDPAELPKDGLAA